MSTYAVFGMTRHRALETARKSVNPADKKGRPIPESEWNELVSEAADKIMKSKRNVMLSEKFDAPQFAIEFLALARKLESRSLVIRAQCKTGGYTKTGRTQMHWVKTT